MAELFLELVDSVTVYRPGATTSRYRVDLDYEQQTQLATALLAHHLERAAEGWR